MKSTRDRIIKYILQNPRSSINDIAQAVGINAISVRHHLANLQSRGLILAEEERHGIGRPRFVYYLTEKGLEHFPTAYLRLTNRLLDQLHKFFSPQTINELFVQMASDMTSNFTQDVELLSFEEKLNLVKDMFTQEGCSTKWEKKGNEYYFHEISCPYYHVSKNHPEICSFSQALISSIMATPIKKISWILDGDAHCTYVIQDVNHTDNEK